MSESNDHADAGITAVATEWARMLDDRTIMVGAMAHVGKSHTHGATAIGPDDDLYAEAKARYKLENPGDVASIDMEFRNGNWVYISEARKVE